MSSFGEVLQQLGCKVEDKAVSHPVIGKIGEKLPHGEGLPLVLFEWEELLVLVDWSGLCVFITTDHSGNVEMLDGHILPRAEFIEAARQRGVLSFGGYQAQAMVELAGGQKLRDILFLLLDHVELELEEDLLAGVVAHLMKINVTPYVTVTN